MSSGPYTPTGGAGGNIAYADYDDEHGQGLVTFAGVMLMIAGVLNVVYGIAAIDKAHVFTQHAHYVTGDLRTWGWFLLGFGILQFAGAFAVWRGTSWARWFAVACASLNAILQTLWIPAYPIMAITILTLDIVAIYGLLAYGGRRKTVHEIEERNKARAAG